LIELEPPIESASEMIDLVFSGFALSDSVLGEHLAFKFRSHVSDLF
jgi:hypothetical protein